MVSAVALAGPTPPAGPPLSGPTLADVTDASGKGIIDVRVKMCRDQEPGRNFFQKSYCNSCKSWYTGSACPNSQPAPAPNPAHPAPKSSSSIKSSSPSSKNQLTQLYPNPK
ncbi:hypothetical protein PCANC_16069 [Puccinia coronata f. sp. avenae]|uniref:Uncharacterized protein n=1 Tax=Puccinia coronata f. sp. avenae TaxID=200324 RepID=A0A2N5UA59_9BASI|nr:hypothetical protein PCASD_15561 [Puccinia coronata f. sp. avenae]PLW34612.1 hypothetical protein PCANC_16069 [Puccinia coronata f. sp. avenae]